MSCGNSSRRIRENSLVHGHTGWPSYLESRLLNKGLTMKLTSRLVSLALLFAALLSAQQITGTVTGIATDPSGAGLPGVLVKVTNLQTNVARETTTEASGAFSLPFLPAASYSLTATAKGFRTFQVDSFVLQVGQTARLD